LKEEEKNKTKKDYPFFTKTIVPIFSYSPADSPLITKEKKKTHPLLCKNPHHPRLTNQPSIPTFTHEQPIFNPTVQPLLF